MRYDTSIPIGIGDVMVTREGPWYASMAIRFGQALMGLPAFCNHVIIVHHQDESGTWWGIEGRPGGVGWIDLTWRFKDKFTNVNNAQYKTDEERYLIAVAAESLLGTAYDWEAIAADAGIAVASIAAQVFQSRLWSIVREWKEDETPAHVVCSSLADWAYEQVSIRNPGNFTRTRMTTPGHWDKFIMDKEWNNG